MKHKDNHISVFEHEKIRFDKGESRLTEKQWKALEKFHGEGCPYFDLMHHGVAFKEYVGVLQVGKTIIEVLPKADKQSEVSDWRSVLINMLRAVGMFRIHAPSSSNLQLKPNSILDLYIDLFIQEVEYLAHQGLIKKYRKKEGNTNSLKGSLHFPKHIQKNLVHQERFYVRYNTYDTQHLLHQILYKCLLLIKRINTKASLISRIGSLLLYFPEQTDLKVTESTFSNINFNRKTESYRKAIEIARLLLLNYHPDLSRGRNDVLALMFDMNLLWEKFVYVSLRKHMPNGVKISAQSKKPFWKPEKGYKTTIRPDIVINYDNGEAVVLDTKWKNLYGQKPTSDDLRQMYVYNRFFGAKKSALVYPGPHKDPLLGQYFHDGTHKLSDSSCSLLPIGFEQDIAIWQRGISDKVVEWSKRG